METTGTFARPEYAQRLAEYLLKPKVLDDSARRGVLLGGERGTGKSTFVQHDLLLALRGLAAETVCIDLELAGTQGSGRLVMQKLQALCKPEPSMAADLVRLRAETRGEPVKSKTAVQAPEGADMVESLQAIVDQRRTSVVLVVDNLQRAWGSAPGREFLQTLKTAQQAINGRPNPPGHFLVVGVGGPASVLREMAYGRLQPLFGTRYVQLETLGEAYIQWVTSRWQGNPGIKLPSASALFKGFETLGHRPVSWQTALEILQPMAGSPDQEFSTICATLARATAEADIQSIQKLGKLAQAVFDGVVRRETANGIYADAALKRYGQSLGDGAEVSKSQVQKTIGRLLEAGWVTRNGDGEYLVADPLLEEVWARRQRV